MNKESNQENDRDNFQNMFKRPSIRNMIQETQFNQKYRLSTNKIFHHK